MYYCCSRCCDGRWCCITVFVVMANLVGQLLLMWLTTTQHVLWKQTVPGIRCTHIDQQWNIVSMDVCTKWTSYHSLSLWFSDWQKVGINARCLIRCCFCCRNVFLHSAVVAADADDAAFIGSCLLWSVHSIPFEMPTNIPQGRQQMCKGLPPPPPMKAAKLNNTPFKKNQQERAQICQGKFLN